MAMFEKETLVLSKSRWEFTDEKTGEYRQGTTLTYVEDLESPEHTNNFFGSKVGKITFEPEMFTSIGDCPAWCKIGYDMRTVGGKPVLKAVSCAWLRLLKPVVSK